jgi:hypothetical protein
MLSYVPGKAFVQDRRTPAAESLAGVETKTSREVVWARAGFGTRKAL